MNARFVKARLPDNGEPKSYMSGKASVGECSETSAGRAWDRRGDRNGAERIEVVRRPRMGLLDRWSLGQKAAAARGNTKRHHLRRSDASFAGQNAAYALARRPHTDGRNVQVRVLDREGDSDWIDVLT
jgi:hypothetical protein